MPLIFVNAFTGETIIARPWQEALGPGDRYIILGPDTVIGEILESAPGAGEGFFYVRGYSFGCPEGEEGLFCCADATAPLTPEAFNALLAAIQRPA